LKRSRVVISVQSSAIKGETYPPEKNTPFCRTSLTLKQQPGFLIGIAPAKLDYIILIFFLKLLVYLSSCYWSWIEFKLVLATTNITNPKEKLNNAIRVITEKIVDNQNTDLINEAIMNKIIIAEFSKTLQTKEIDEENKEGYFLIYKSVINRIVNIINEVNPKYPFAKSLTSSIVEGSLHQHFLTEHLKTITDCNEVVTATQFYIDLAENVLSQNQ
jgi:hypothetical protein